MEGRSRQLFFGIVILGNSHGDTESLAACVQGDNRDMALMAVSIAVLVYLSMNMYNMYAMLYYAAGLKPLSEYIH